MCAWILQSWDLNNSRFGTWSNWNGWLGGRGGDWKYGDADNESTKFTRASHDLRLELSEERLLSRKTCDSEYGAGRIRVCSDIAKCSNKSDPDYPSLPKLPAALIYSLLAVSYNTTAEAMPDTSTWQRSNSSNARNLERRLSSKGAMFNPSL